MSFSLWVVAQVQGTGCRLGQVRDPAITGWVNWWGPTVSGSWYSTGLSNLWVPTRSRDLVTLYRISLWKSWWYSPFYDAQTIWNLSYFFIWILGASSWGSGGRIWLSSNLDSATTALSLQRRQQLPRMVQLLLWVQVSHSIINWLWLCELMWFVTCLLMCH